MAKSIHEYVSPSRGVLVTEGLTFDPDPHKYYYCGKELSGITGTIGKSLKKNFEVSFVEEGRTQGSHVHESVEAWIKTGNIVSVHPAVRWIITELEKIERTGKVFFSEVLISDFTKYATAIDILAQVSGTDEVVLCDMKAGAFNRKYVTRQLSIEKYFVEMTTGWHVKSAFCISSRDREFYPIIFEDRQIVKSVLYPY